MTKTWSERKSGVTEMLSAAVTAGVFFSALLYGRLSHGQALPSLDQCLKTEPPAITINRPKMKFYTGHYINIGQRAASGYFDIVLSEIKATKAAGIMKRYTWSDLEPAQDKWQFDTLKRDLDLAQANGKKVFPLIQFKFKNMADEPSVPGYVRRYEGGIHYYNLPSGQGTVPNFGRSFSQNRFLKLLKEIAVRFDSHPALAGISFNETFSGYDFGNDSAAKYAYSMGLIRVDKGAACLFRRTPVIQMTNYPKAYLDEMGAAYKAHAIGIGAPNIYTPVPNDDLTGIGASYDYFRILYNFVPRAAMINDQNYKCLGLDQETQKCIPSNESPEQSVIRTYDIARNALAVNYIFWNRAGNADPYYQTLLNLWSTSTVIGELNRECPSNYGGGCSN